MGIALYFLIAFTFLLFFYFIIYGTDFIPDADDEDVTVVMSILVSVAWPVTIPVLIFGLVVMVLHEGLKHGILRLRENRKKRKESK